MDKTAITTKINEIAANIYELAPSNLGHWNTSLIGGTGGMLLFMNYYNRFCDAEKYSEIYDTFLAGYLEDLSNGARMHTYAGGVAGILTLLKHLNEENFLELDYSEFENAYRPILLAQMVKDFASENFDYLHGGIGVALYFDDDPEFIRAAVEGLEKSAVRDGDRLKWIGSLGMDRGNGYNISLSHGYSSILIYLSRIYGKGVEDQRILDLMNGTANYIISQRIDENQYGSCFVSQSLENGDPIHQSRLGWCYGDLGVAAALWQGGKAIGNDSWCELALETMRYTCTRLDPVKGNVMDAGICHGSAGISTMFRYFYEQTGEQLFKDTADYWIDITLKLARFEDGNAGYKIYRHDTETKFENCEYLLEGTSGVGLELLHALFGTEASAWTKIFLV